MDGLSAKKMTVIETWPLIVVFLVAALILNSFTGCLRCQLGYLILLCSNCQIICFHNDLRGVPVEIAGMHAKYTFHNKQIWHIKHETTIKDAFLALYFMQTSLHKLVFQPF